MNYAACIQKCVDFYRSEGQVAQAELIVAHPIPTRSEWKSCRNAVAARGEDPGSPFALLGEYELRLGKRGYETALGMEARVFGQFAEKFGLSHDRLEDMLKLTELRAKEASQ